MRRVLALFTLLAALVTAPATALAATATFTDANLVAAVDEQLTALGVSHTTDANAKTVELSDAALASVTSLDLSSRDIGSTAGLGTFSSLARLDLSHNKLNSIDGLAGLTGLTYLDLYDNFVHDLAPLQNLTALTHLNLGENNEQAKGSMANLSALDGLADLTWLDFSQNFVPDIPAHVGKLAKLEFVNLQQNGITDVSALATLANLRTLILSHNSVSGINALLGLKQLEELNLQGNRLYQGDSGTDNSGIDGLVSDNGTLALPNLKKLDLYDNWAWEGLRGSTSKANTDTLLSLDQAGKLELGYSYDFVKNYDAVLANVESPRNTPTANLPHTDAATNTPYVTYDDFGAYCDGIHDDFNAMRNAHRYANAKGCEVRATAGKTYHIFRPYDLTYYNAYTNVDWQGATFVVHDENIDELGTRFVPLLCLRPSPARATTKAQGSPTLAYVYNDRVTLNDPAGTVSKATTSVGEWLAPTLSDLASKGYSRFYVQVFNADKKHYIRYGSNANGGSDQWDGFVVDAQGKLVDGQCVQWDFDKLTKVLVTPVPDAQSYVRNATFVSMPTTRVHEVPYGRGGGKPIYYQRNLQIRDCTNVAVSGITQTVGTAEGGYDHDALMGSTTGFLQVQDCADVSLEDCAVWTRRYSQNGRSTYGLTFNCDVNLTCTRVSCSNPWEQLLDPKQRWGVMGSNHVKHVSFESCVLNRIDAHEGFYDMSARNCKLGGWGFRLTGQGPMVIDHCDVYANSFIMLRGDYGSTWDGTATITDCTHYVRGTDAQGLFSVAPSYENGGIHDFGYELHFPNLYVENLTVDERDWSNGKDTYYIVPNHSYDERNTLLPASYWPDSVQVKGVNFINYEDTVGYEPAFRLVSREDGTIADKLAGYVATGVTYNGVGDHLDLASGQELKPANPTALVLPFTLVPGSNDNAALNRFSLTAEQLAGNELAIAYTGELPRVAFMDEDWQGWTSVEAFYVERGTECNIAYFSADTVAKKWAASQGTAWETKDAEGNVKSGTVGAYDRFRIWNYEKGESVIQQVVLLDASVHTWGEWTTEVAATCTTPGTERRVCTDNPSHVQTRTVSALGHAWEGEPTVDVAPTCTEPGVQSTHCSRCDERRDVVELAALGHDWEWATTTPPTAIEPGVETGTCRRDPTHTTTRTLPALGHDWGAWEVVTQPTCAKPGVRTRTDENAPQVTETESIPALGHAWEGEPTVDVAPTCTEPGSQSVHCTRCDERRDVAELAATGHVDDGGTVTKEATATENGTKTHVCAVCGEVLYTEVIPKTATDDDAGGVPGGDEPPATPEPQAYRVILNADGTWVAGADGAERGYTLSSDADFSKFVCVLVDGVVVDPACYTAESGSTKITLHAAYLATLAEGVHEVVIRSVDGDARTMLTVYVPRDDDVAPAAARQPVARQAGRAAIPATGDTSLSVVPLIAAALALLIFAYRLPTGTVPFWRA